MGSVVLPSDVENSVDEEELVPLVETVLKLDISLPEKPEDEESGTPEHDGHGVQNNAQNTFEFTSQFEKLSN